MAEPRKVFRIEATAASRLGDGIEDAQAPLRHTELMAELAALRAMLTAITVPSAKTAAPRPNETERLTSELNLIAGAIRGGEPNQPGGAPGATSSMTRIGYELEEVVSGTERATQKVLVAAEEIDQIAKSLSSARIGIYEQGLAQDIQDLVIKIFEACNFQDLAGQRIAKVLGVLSFVEDHVGRVLAEIKNPTTAARHDGAQYLHGPRLESDDGHVTQAEIDAMFGG